MNVPLNFWEMNRSNCAQKILIKEWQVILINFSPVNIPHISPSVVRGIVTHSSFYKDIEAPGKETQPGVHSRNTVGQTLEGKCLDAGLN